VKQLFVVVLMFMQKKKRKTVKEKAMKAFFVGLAEELGKGLGRVLIAASYQILPSVLLLLSLFLYIIYSTIHLLYC